MFQRLGSGGVIEIVPGCDNSRGRGHRGGRRSGSPGSSRPQQSQPGEPRSRPPSLEDPLMVESVVGSVARRVGLGSIFATAALAISAATALGQGLPQPRTFKPLNSYTAETLLRRAAEQAKQGQWAEAIDLYQKV